MATESAATTVDHGLAPGAPLQMEALVASIAGVLVGLLLAVCWCSWVTRRDRGHEATTPDQGGGPPEPPAAFPRPIQPTMQLAAVGILAVFLLPAAAAMRQLWPHPDLGLPMLAAWVGILLIELAAWFLLVRAMAVRGPRP